jgi:hypothetical protein
LIGSIRRTAAQISVRWWRRDTIRRRASLRNESAPPTGLIPKVYTVVYTLATM